MERSGTSSGPVSPDPQHLSSSWHLGVREGALCTFCKPS